MAIFFRNPYLLAITLAAFTLAPSSHAAEVEALTPASVIAASNSADWRTADQANLMYLTLEHGQVIFELANDFAPAHIANLRVLVSEQYFDGLAVTRSQDNYVAQWGDPNAGTDSAKSKGKAAATLEAEFFRSPKNLSFTAIDSRDAYADTVGFSKGFSAARDENRAWLTHCYGALGAGRDMAADSGSAAELYVVTGHSPRHLDRNVTLLGRAISGIEHLSSLPRGTGTLGFFAENQQTVPIKSIRMGNELEAKQQTQFEIMRTDTPTFSNYVQSRTYRLNDWFLDKTGKIEVCNVGVPVRLATK